MAEENIISTIGDGTVVVEDGVHRVFNQQYAALKECKSAQEVYDTLSRIDFAEKIDNRNDLNYISWASMVAEVMKRFADFEYEIRWFDGKPYYYDEMLNGFIVFTSVTIEGVKKEMWLPVLDSSNHPLRREDYTVQTKYKEIPVKACTVSDINKSLMRCLTKNIAQFGAGIYVYEGSDLPDVVSEEIKRNEEEEKALNEARKKVKETGNELIKCGVTKEELWAAVEKHNNGSKSVADIESVDVCNVILDELNTLKKNADKATTKKTTKKKEN